MIEAHYSSLSSQSSIYGLTSLSTETGCNKVLTASSKRKVYCTEYSSNNTNLVPSTREVQFTYIPGGAEIISIDAFNQACHEHDFVVGITFIKVQNRNTGGDQSQYFNIYSDWEPSSELDLDNIAQGCLSLPLEFIPFQLTHTQLFETGTKEMVWLLSGNDYKIHLYREDKSSQSFAEELMSEKYFPEFSNLNSVVLWMDFITTTTKRVTAIGCQDGTVTVTLLHTNPEIKVVSSWSIQHDCPIACVQLFVDSEIVANPKDNKAEREKTKKECKLELPIHLVVGNTLEISVSYRDILNKGLTLSSQNLLSNSSKFDCVTCICIADIDMDGKNELLLGTYGQELLCYKWQYGNEIQKGSYALLHQQSFPNPLLAIAYIDITGDGVKELIVLSTKGLHILQHDLQDVAELCTKRLKILNEILTNDKRV